MSDTADLPPANEAAFHEAVLRLGGRATLDVVGLQEGIQTADWLWADERVVIEHKSIESDFAAGKHFLERRPELERELAVAGDRAAFGAAILREFDIFLSSLMKKANSQIKSTIALVGWGDPAGILVLANTGLRDLPPKFIGQVLHRILRRKFSAIQGVIYLPDHYASRDNGQELLVRMSILGPNARADMTEIMKRLVIAYDAYMAELTGEVMPRFETSDRRSLDGLNAAGARRRLPSTSEPQE
ncbi:hypothetical protein BH10PSE4_BH10PSE4_35120 [soil metagenome]